VGSARIAEPGTVVVPTSLAQKLGLREDATLPVGFADGETVPLRISAVRPGSDIVIARDLVRAHDSSALTDTIFIPRAAGPATVGPGAKADDAEGFAAQKYEKDMSLLGWFSLVLLVLAGGYTGIAVANTMAMAAQGRRTDFAVLRSAGATVRQVLLLVMGETALIVVIGTALGLLITLPPLAAMAAGLAESTGIPVGLRSDWPTVVIVVASCLTLAVTASVVMTWRPLRDRH
jgi:putative ABC transport system permease protein